MPGRTVDILKSVDINGEVIQYLHSRRCIETMVRGWKDCTTKDDLTLVDHREIILGLDLLYYQLRGSDKIQFCVLFEEMVQSGGYQVLCNLLKMGPFNQTILNLKVNNNKNNIKVSIINFKCNT